MQDLKTITELTRDSTNWARWNMVNQADEMVVAHLNTATGEAIYKTMSEHWPFEDQRASGVIPINHVLSYRVGAQKLQVGTPLMQQTQVRLYGQRQADGCFRRLHMRGHCDVRIEGQDETAASAEYWIALTKPFAPPDQRRVHELPEALQSLQLHDYPDDALPLQDLETYRVDAAALTEVGNDVFHINQTDMNKHVNTIVYLDLAQDHVCSLAARNGVDVARIRFRQLDVFYRKPFAAGQIYQWQVDFKVTGDRFSAAVRYYHTDGSLAEARPSSRISVGLTLSGELG